MTIPNDPAILLSFVNTKLRDEYSDLDELCKSLCADRSDIIKKLSDIGFSYDSKLNRFV